MRMSAIKSAAIAGLLLVFPGSAQNLVPAAFRPLDAVIRAGTYGNIDRVYVLRGGKPVVDLRYERDYKTISRGKVSRIGCGEGCTDPDWMHQYNYFHPDWHPFFQGRPVHTLQSVTKSIAATTIGVAIQRGDLAAEALKKPFLDFFTEYNLSKIDPRLRRATLEDVLTMRSGIEWHEGDRPLDETNTTVQLEWSKDWIQFTLDQPMDADPGTKWAYNSGGSELLAQVIRKATGQHIDDYARAHLFGPLGITDFQWKRTPTGHPDTEGGLYLGAEDLAKIGTLYLNKGVWDGHRMLSEAFIADATTRHVSGAGSGGNWDYGYQWWLTRVNDVDVWAGRGFGGQLLVVVPERNTVGVVLAWNVFGKAVVSISEHFVALLVGAGS